MASLPCAFARKDTAYRLIDLFSIACARIPESLRLAGKSVTNFSGKSSQSPQPLTAIYPKSRHAAVLISSWEEKFFLPPIPDLITKETRFFPMSTNNQPIQQPEATPSRKGIGGPQDSRGPSPRLLERLQDLNHFQNPPLLTGRATGLRRSHGGLQRSPCPRRHPGDRTSRGNLQDEVAPRSGHLAPRIRFFRKRISITSMTCKPVIPR